MASTPSFNWSTPDNTGLVKNGALDIRTLGDAIDTSMADLLGGTTGQVLTKASNTDMDFTWATDATGIPATIFDAKGDIIAATAADTASRLAVGTNGQVLTADSTAATGLKWATPAAGGGGKVLQVVQGTYSTQVGLASSTTYIDSGLSLSITPTLSTSKVLVMVNQTFRASTGSAVGTGGALKMLRGSTDIYNPNPGGYEIHYWESPTSGSREAYDMKSLVYLDSPATTSATTYKTQIRCTGGSDAVYAQPAGAVSVITLMEIGA